MLAQSACETILTIIYTINGIVTEMLALGQNPSVLTASPTELVQHSYSLKAILKYAGS